MASKNFQAQRRIRYKRREQAHRLAACAPQATQSAKPDRKGTGGETAGQKAPGQPAEQPTAPIPLKQLRHPRRATAKSRPEIKVIGLRERVRILKKVVVWGGRGSLGEGKRQRNRIQKLEQENLLLRADIAEMKRVFARGLGHQSK